MTLGSSSILVKSDIYRNGVEHSRRNWTMVCAPIKGDDTDEMLVQMKKAKELGADMVEIRMDHLKKEKMMSPQQCVEILIKQSPLPTIITYRPTWEGGQYNGDESTRHATLRHAIDSGADYIEIELKVAAEFFNSMKGTEKPGKTKIIVSSHNYESTPSAEELGNLAARIQATGADVVKIVTTAQDITDSARIFQLLGHSQVPTIGFAMGEKGFISRVLCAKYGGFLTFASLEPGIVSSPGEPTVKDLLGLYNFRKIGPDTKVHGVIGNPIGHSKSPHLYNPVFVSANFDGVYLPLLVNDVASFLNTYSSPDFVGYSFTVPHKESGLKCCDKIDPIAKEIGAISCMLRKPSDGKLIGYNMDYLGAVAAIEEGLRGSSYDSVGVDSPLAGKLFVVIGAGGAGKALAYAGKVKGARVVVTDAIYDKAKELASKVAGQVIALSELDDFHPEDRMILANATPVGMEPNTEATPISKDALRNYSLVFDAIYTPKWTRLLKEAQETGAKVVFGTEMFVNQAFIQFGKFTGLPAPKESTRKTLAKYA